MSQSRYDQKQCCINPVSSVSRKRNGFVCIFRNGEESSKKGTGVGKKSREVRCLDRSENMHISVGAISRNSETLHRRSYVYNE